MTSLRVRQATERDLHAMEHILLNAIQKNYARFMPEEYILDCCESDVANTVVCKDIARTGVAVIDEKVLGFAIYDKDFITELWVSPAAQGTGVGKALMSWSESKLIEAGHTVANLCCYGENESALKFYNKLQYTAANSFMSTEVRGGPVPVLTLSKTLGLEE